MRNDKKLGLLLMGLALVATIGIWMYFVTNESIPYDVLAFPSIMFMAGAAIFFFDFIENGLGIQDELEEAGTLLADDLEALRTGQVTQALVMSVLTLFGSGIWVYLIVLKEKWEADWYGVPVLAIALVVSLLLAVMMVKMDWFQYRRWRTPKWILSISVIGLILCAFLGIYFAEPVPDLHGDDGLLETDQPVNQEYDYSRTRISRTTIYHWFTSSNSSSSGASSIEMPECDGDSEGCGYVYLGILVVIIFIVCVVGSAFIPHFWVVATLIMLAMMWVKTLRELFYIDHYTSRRRSLM